MHDATQFKPKFHDMFVNSIHMEINSFACVPFTEVNAPSDSGVKRLIALFDHSYDRRDGTLLNGLALESDAPLVVPL